MKLSNFFDNPDKDTSLIAAIDSLVHHNDENVQIIIEALDAGADPLKKGELNTALTAAIVMRKADLVDFILNKYPKGHPIFSEHDTFIGNTPLSLAIKTGQYEFAERLIEKNCDVNCKIGHEPYFVYPLHLCVFLLGTSGDDREAESLVKIIKLLIEKGANKNEILHWGQTPYDILMMNIDKDDFALYRDDRNYFEYYHNNPFSSQDVAIGSHLLTIFKKIAEAEETIAEKQDQENDITDVREFLTTLKEEVRVYESQYPLIVEEVQQFIEFDKFIVDYKFDNMANDAELRELSTKYATQNPKFVKMADHFNRTDVYSIQELKQKFKRNIPVKINLMEGIALTNAWYPYLAYALFEHFVWHRPGFRRENVTVTRNYYFETEVGEKVRSELSTKIEPVIQSLGKF